MSKLSVILAAVVGLTSQAAFAAATGDASAYPHDERARAAARAEAPTAGQAAGSASQYVVRGDVIVVNPAYVAEPTRSAREASATDASRTIYVN